MEVKGRGKACPGEMERASEGPWVGDFDIDKEGKGDYISVMIS